MGILVTAIVGGVIGWLASIVMGTTAQMGILANVIVGIIGASLGSWLAASLGIVTAGGIAGLLVGVFGACVLLFILKALNIFK
jgi:uncharacterized membrane protein YeaQ/YmgE (transglycosylase-associated protein family)